MLDVVNRLADGFVSVPVIDACSRGGVFTKLSEEPWDPAALSETLGANEGHLRVALRLLDGLGWVDTEADCIYRLTEAGARSSRHLPGDLTTMLERIAAAVGGDETALADWLDRCAACWTEGSGRHPLADLLDGALLAPVLVEVDRRGGAEALDTGRDPLGPKATQSFLRLLARFGWAEPDGTSFRLSPEGRYLVDSGAKLATVVSYWPMLRQMDELLFGDATVVFERDAQGHERHLDRALNVSGSSAQHDLFFRTLVDAIVGYFESLPIAEQPTHIADLGCGDGTLLLHLHEAVATRTGRGQVLDRHPLTLVAADFNAASLDAARDTLADLPHQLVQADIGDPAGFMAELALRGVDPDTVLHVRSFVDHDRPLLPPRDEAGLERQQKRALAGVHVDRSGGAIAAAVAVQSLVEHLARWRSVVGRHGLLALEVHCLHAPTVRRLGHVTESLHFDAYHGFAGQHLVEAPTFVLAAAEAGLLPQSGAARRFPRLGRHTRITLNRFIPGPYRIRPATPSDIDVLWMLERAALPASLRSRKAQLKRRLAAFPEGQLVLETGDAVIGALYMQRITDSDALDGVKINDVEDLHRPDGPVAQLLSLLMHPDHREGLGAEVLLDFALDYLALMDGVDRVVGVTRCQDYGSQAERALSHAAYVEQRDSNGLPVDPVLLMHVSHGARIVRVMEGFRPRDAENEGHGVLIAYDLDRRHAAVEGQATAPADEMDGDAVEVKVRDAVLRILGPQRCDAYAGDRPFMSMGLESLDLLELRQLLSEVLGTRLDSTFFFRNGTPEAVIGHFTAGGEAKTGRRGPVSPRMRYQPGRTQAEPSSFGAPGYAIVGMAGRFPGAASVSQFWSLLAAGGEGVGEIPAERWRLFETSCPALDGLPRRGGLLSEIDCFDAAFFRISPREAALLDPQQRLLLEVVWHALENAGLPPAGLAGSSTGLFIGLMGHDYETLLLQVGTSEIDGHFATGSAGSIAVGRLAHVFDWRGPAVTVDTACSSSLVALNQACQSLRLGGCDLAVAGGVNLTLAAPQSLAYWRAGMLSADGRCKTFDAAADGYVRGEGCGVVVLKRLSDAERDGDRIHAVIRGSAVNQDGTGIGLTAPNETAQAQLIAAALAETGLRPSDVDYLECHGTGTELGDPIEVRAAASAYGEGRDPERPLLLGSVKTNIGHLEAAAGIAGLIKAVLALEHGQIPKHLNLTTPNPHIDWDALPVRVTTQATPLPRLSDRPARAAVSSFGFSGTNAHVVLEGYGSSGEVPSRAVPVVWPSVLESAALEAPAVEGLRPRCHRVLALSAKSAAALPQLAQAYLGWLEATGPADAEVLADLSYTAGVGRSHFAERAGLVFEDAGELKAGLEALASGVSAAGLMTGSRAAGSGAVRVAFVFTGQGSQWVGMGRDLYESEPVFRAVLDRCDGVLRDLRGVSLLDVMFGREGACGDINDTAWTQPALYALEVGLTALWRSVGVEPCVVLGHSVGELAAAHAAGVLSLEEGLRLAASRGALMGALPVEGASAGAMAAVFAGTERVAALLEEINAGTDDVGLSVAAENGSHRVVSGPVGLIADLEDRLSAEGVRVERLVTSHAFHSALMDPMLADLEEVVSGLSVARPRVPLISNVTGRVVGENEMLDGAYWRRHAREAVRFADGVAALRVRAWIF